MLDQYSFTTSMTPVEVLRYTLAYMDQADVRREPRQHGSSVFHVACYDNYRHNVRFDPRVIRVHWHPESELLRVVRRRMLVRVDDQEIQVSPGELVYIPHGAIHSAHAHDDGKIYYDAVVFDLSLIESSSLDESQLHVVRPVIDGSHRLPLHIGPSSAAGSAVLREFDELRASYFSKAPGFELYVKGALSKIISLLFAGGERAPQHSRAHRDRRYRIKPVLNYIHNNYSEALELDQLARVAGVSRYHFCRLFRQITGKSPAAYVTEYRVHQAEHMLEQSDRSVTEIAFEVGFNDLTYFGRCFRRYRGRTPTEFRNRD